MNETCKEHYNNLLKHATRKELQYEEKRTESDWEAYQKAQNNLYYYVLALYDAGIITEEQYEEMIL